MAAGSKPGFMDTLRAGGRPPQQRGRPTGVGPRGKGGRRQPTAAAGGPNGAAPVGTPVGQPHLLKQREELSRQFAELQWGLGGMAYEMAARDHYRLDVLNKQAARLQKVDAELGQIERVLRLDQAGAAGTCPSCGALQARGAVFCWQCGNELRPSAKASQSKAKGTVSKAAKPAKAAAGTAKSAAGKARSAAGKANPRSRSKPKS